MPISLFAKATLHCFPSLPMKWQVPLIDTFYFITTRLYKMVILGNWKCSTMPDLMNMRWKRIREFEWTGFVTKLRTLVKYCVRGRIMKDWNNWFMNLTELDEVLFFFLPLIKEHLWETWSCNLTNFDPILSQNALIWKLFNFLYSKEHLTWMKLSWSCSQQEDFSLSVKVSYH